MKPNNTAPKRYGGCATDVIVVRRRDGSLASTSFHVHFGAKWRDRVVEVAVNDIPVPVVMKVNELGFAMWNSTAAQIYQDDEEDLVAWQQDQPYGHDDDDDAEEEEEEDEDEEEEVPSEAFIELDDYESSSSLASSISSVCRDNKDRVRCSGNAKGELISPPASALPHSRTTERSRSRESQNARKVHHHHRPHGDTDDPTALTNREVTAAGGEPEKKGCERLLVPVMLEGDGERSPLRVYAPKDSPSPCASLDPVAYRQDQFPATMTSGPGGLLRSTTKDNNIRSTNNNNSYRSSSSTPHLPRQRRAASPPQKSALPPSSSGASYGVPGWRGGANSPGDQSQRSRATSSGRQSPARLSNQRQAAVVYEDPIPTHLPSQVELEAMGLAYGENEISFTILGEKWSATAAVYLWDDTDRLIISDVDGTITKSDLLGHAYAFAGYGAYWIHPGICSLYANIDRNGYHLVYLTARSMHLARSTRKFLLSLEQGKVFLPRGPLFSSPTSFFSALKQEVGRRSHIFKIHCLNDMRKAFSDTSNPFFAAFGNRYSDYVAYTEAGISPRRIYLLDSKSSVKLSGMKFHLTNAGDPSLLDARFPPRRRHGLEDLIMFGPTPAPPPPPPAHSVLNVASSSVGEGASATAGGDTDGGGAAPHTSYSLPPTSSNSGVYFHAANNAYLAGASGLGTALSSPSRSQVASPVDRYPTLSSPSLPAPYPHSHPHLQPVLAPSMHLSHSGSSASFPMGASANTNNTILSTPQLRHTLDLEAEQEFSDHIFWRIDPMSLISSPPTTSANAGAGSKKDQNKNKPTSQSQPQPLTMSTSSLPSGSAPSPLTATTMTNPSKKKDGKDSPGYGNGASSSPETYPSSFTSARTDPNERIAPGGTPMQEDASLLGQRSTPASPSSPLPSAEVPSEQNKTTTTTTNSRGGRRFFFFGKGKAKGQAPTTAPPETSKSALTPKS